MCVLRSNMRQPTPLISERPAPSAIQCSVTLGSTGCQPVVFGSLPKSSGRSQRIAFTNHSSLLTGWLWAGPWRRGRTRPRCRGRPRRFRSSCRWRRRCCCCCRGCCRRRECGSGSPCRSRSRSQRRCRRCCRTGSWCATRLHFKGADVDATIYYAGKTRPTLIVQWWRSKVRITRIDCRAAR